MYQVFSGQKPPFSREGIPPAYEALIEDCWLDEPEARPSFAAILLRLRGMYSEERRRGAAAQPGAPMAGGSAENAVAHGSAGNGIGDVAPNAHSLDGLAPGTMSRADTGRASGSGSHNTHH